MAIETLGAALRQVGRLFAGGVVAGLSDRQLLDLFIERRDADAFEVLVARHGRMVLSVCRGILRDPDAAEDAFQATFLVLVKKARTIRGPNALGGWLHRVARRVAIEANRAAARRRAGEKEVAAMASATAASGTPPIDRLLEALHEEIDRLPEPQRLAIVLCELEGLTQAQAADRLDWSERTLRRRLGEARDRLKARLGRRGLEADDARLGAVFLREARAPLPPAWCEATARAALGVLDPAATAGAATVVAQSLTQEVLKAMFVQKLTIAAAALLGAGLVAWAAGAIPNPRGDDPPTVAPGAAARQAAPAHRPEAKADPTDETGTVPVRGRVLDPDGRPVAGAGIYVRHHIEVSGQWTPSNPMAARQKGLVATTDAAGRFHFGLDQASSEVASEGGPGWHKAQVAAAAPGFAPAWVEAGDLVKGRELTLRLVRDDVPVRGRILDSQGRPVAGVVVRIRWIWEPRDGVDLDAMLVSGELDEGQMARWYGTYERAPTWQADPAPLWPGGRDAWTTDIDGRFEVRGIGRDRIARLDLHGGGVADATLYAMARAAKAPPRARPRPVREFMVESLGREAAFMGHYPQGTPLLGATFDYIAGPTKPIAGVVRLKESGRPVAGVFVRGADPATHTAITARTDAAGHFRLDGVPKGEFYQLRLNPRPGIDPFLGHAQIVNDTEGLKPIEVSIDVTPGVIVTGRLVDRATGRPVAPAYVGYVKAPSNASPGDAAPGFSWLNETTFGLTVPPGLGMIAATAAVRETDDAYACAHLKPADRGKGIGDMGGGETFSFPLSGYHTYRYIEVPSGGGPVAVDLGLNRGLGREGRLTDPDGRPVVGVRAYGLNARWGSILTLDRGSTFEVRGLEPGHPRLLVFTHKDRKLVGAIVLKDEDLKSGAPLEVRLVPAGAITGRILDEDGHPMAGAGLHVTMYEPGRAKNLPDGPGSLWPSDETFTTDAQGRFRVEGFVPGVQAVVSVSAPNRPPSFLFGGGLDAGDAFRNLALDRGEVRDLGDVRVRKRPQ